MLNFTHCLILSKIDIELNILQLDEYLLSIATIFFERFSKTLLCEFKLLAFFPIFASGFVYAYNGNYFEDYCLQNILRLLLEYN